MIGDKNPDMRLKDCEWPNPKLPAWKCPYTGTAWFNGKTYCKNHANKALALWPKDPDE